MSKDNLVLNTKKINVFEATENDINFIMDMEKAVENRNFIWQGTYEEHLNEIKNKDCFLWIFKNLDNKFIGYSLSKFDSKSEVFELRRIAISEKGKGYGKAALKIIIKYAFEQCGANRFWLDVYPDNNIGIKLYESFGMHRDGVLRQSYKSERGYLDQVIYSILKKEYFENDLTFSKS